MTTVLGYYALACLTASIGWIAYRSLSAAMVRRRQVNDRLTDLYDDDTAIIDFLTRARTFEGS